MKFKEFEQYVDPLLTSKEYFCEKALELQNKRNKKRAPSKSWAPEKMNRAVEKMWEENVEGLDELKDVKYDNDGSFSEDNDCELIRNEPEIKNFDESLEQDFKDFLFNNDDFRQLNEEEQETVLSDPPKFIDYA